MAKTPKPARGTFAPYGDEYATAIDLINAGKGDGAIAAQISAGRASGVGRVDPLHIAAIRTDRNRR